jgi:hypothetical protein
MTTLVKELEESMRRTFPHGTVEHSPPRFNDGVHFLSLRAGELFVSVLWNPRDPDAFRVADPHDEDGAFDAVRNTRATSVAEAIDVIADYLGQKASASAP